MTTAHIERQVEARLKHEGVRLTRARREVLNVLIAADGPQSAAEIQQRLSGSVPMSSLYRSISVLSNTGILDPHHGSKDVTRYEVAESLAGHHHHLVCSECGSVDDITLSHDLEEQLDLVVGRLADSASFAATGHSLEIEGRCSRCMS